MELNCLTVFIAIVQLSNEHVLELKLDIVIDTSAIIAVIAGEPERMKIIELTSGNTLIGPGSIPWEIGNAFSAMLKRNRLSLEEAKRGLEIFRTIPLRYIELDFANAISISRKNNIYAYDAYFLECALKQKAPLLTLDLKLKSVAADMKISALEV